MITKLDQRQNLNAKEMAKKFYDDYYENKIKCRDALSAIIHMLDLKYIKGNIVYWLEVKKELEAIFTNK